MKSESFKKLDKRKVREKKKFETSITIIMKETLKTNKKKLSSKFNEKIGSEMKKKNSFTLTKIFSQSFLL